jgi:GNAT superfamily N-acetyltransferase
MELNKQFDADISLLGWFYALDDSAAMPSEQFDRQTCLSHGLAVRLRAVRCNDKYALLAAYNQLSDRTIYLRFMRTRFEPSLRQVSYFTDLDFKSHVSLVVETIGPNPVIIGVGRYIVLDGGMFQPFRAEYACIVADSYQRVGVGRLLFRQLVHIAIAQGIHEFVAEVLPENRGMLSLFRHSGLPLTMNFSDGMVHVRIGLALFQGASKAN